MRHPDSPEYQATKSTGQHFPPPKGDEMTPENESISPKIRGYLDPRDEARFDIWWSAIIAPNLERSRAMAIARLQSLQFDDEWMMKAREKAREGRVQHGGDIEHMTPAQLQEEIWQEDVDGLIYGAAFQARVD